MTAKAEKLAMAPEVRAVRRTTPASPTCSVTTALAAAARKATVYDVPASSESDWQNFPHDLMMTVVAELSTKSVTALMTSCNQWRVQLSTVVEKARLSRLPMFSSHVSTAQRKFVVLSQSRPD